MPKKGYTAPNTQVKKYAPPSNQQKFSDVTYSKLTYDYYTDLNKDIQYLKKVLFSWSLTNPENYLVPNQRKILCEYIDCYHQYTQFDQFDHQFSTLTSLNVNLERINNKDLIYKSFNIFKKCKWAVRFDSKFISKITQCTLNQIKYILSFVMYLAHGNFISKSDCPQPYGYVKALPIKSFPFNRFFSLKCFKQKNLIVHVGVQKIPVVSRGNVIKRYEFKSYIQFVDIISDQYVQNPKKLQERMKLYMDKIVNDVAKRDHSDELQIQQPANKVNKNAYFFYTSLNPYTNQIGVFQSQFNNTNKVYHPLQFKVYYVSSQQTSTLIFNKQMKRWISQDFLDRQERRKLNQFQRKINQQMVKRFVDFQSAKTLVELLTKIPNFKVKLTDQQKDVIGQNGNVMVIGRSGTGKTTCAVLRLFSIEMLFKIRLSLYKKKFSSQISNTRCSSNDIDDAMGLHCIFLTASPVLTNEIQRYYKKLTTNIKEQLQKKKKRVEQQRKRKQAQQRAIQQEQNEDQNSQIKQKQEEQIQIPQKIQRVKSKQVIEEESQMNQQLKDIKLQEDVQNQDFNQDQQDFDKVKEQFQQKIQKYQSLQDLQQKDYPGFFTVRSYIKMIDGVLPKPFFVRKKGNNNIVDEQSKAAWHNERKGVMMIQNYYRNEQNQKQQINQKALNDIQQQINYSDEQQLEHEYMRQIQLRANQDKQQLTKKLIAKKKSNPMSFQVDYQYFLTYFWPNVNRRFYSSRNITPQLVWTEIYSTIKGSATSHQYSGQYMPQKVYISQSTNVFLTKDQKLDIYQTFCQYERWKIKNGGYDIMDTVNYILNSIRFRGYNGPEIHYVMIDQVQDLPHAIIYLLSKTASYGVFYSGDTAQTIAKGVGFRFCDLKSLFDQRLFDASLQLKKPIVKHLTVNFRSHNNILQLANSVVSCLQILFPKTIDKLAKQRSNLDGPKPMILAENDEQLLFYVLCGQQQNKPKQSQGMKKPPLQFGCDQVIIVRDQDSKQRVPGMLQHALCLTIYEAKGLQFNDVILFNFFTQCKHPEKWNLLKYLKVVDYEISKQEYEKGLTVHNLEKKQNDIQNQGDQKPEQMQTQVMFQQKNNVIKIKKIVSQIKKIMKDINDYAELCSDLKLFYTAITRPRKTLIIYDEDPTCRKLIQKMWENLGIIQIVTKSLIEAEALNSTISQNSGTSIFTKVVCKTDKTQWKKQGLKMYTRGYFQQAMKCFQKSDNQQLYKKSKANLLADKATKVLIEVQSQRNSIKQGFIGYREMTSSDLSKLKIQLIHKESKSYVQFYLAAQIFQELKMYKQAGQCYFSGKKYQKAKQMFVNAKMYKQAAQSNEMLGQYREAAIYYDNIQDYLKVIQCLDMINQWQQILKIIKKYEQKMSQLQKTSLLKKYAALALQALVYEVQFQNEDSTGNRKENSQNNRIEVIAQKQSDQQDEQMYSDSDLENEVRRQIDPQREAEKSYNKKQKKIIDEDQEEKQGKDQQNLIQTVYEQKNGMQQTVYQKVEPVKQQVSESFSDLNQQTNKQKQQQQISEQKINQNMLQTMKEQQSFSQLNQPIQALKNESIKQNGKQQNQQAQSSFSDLNASQNFSDLNAKYQKQLDPDIQSIRSLADPQDPWIRSAISQINPKSQYSIIDQSENYNLNVKIIKTKGNIFIQDQIMEKIIRIVSIINESSTAFLQNFKGYQSLITLNKSQNHQNIIQSNQITDFQDIDSETINIILDTLESFKLYKLCLFVCNRYHLPEKAGRYLISIMLKYSPNCQSNTVIHAGLLAPSTQRKAQLQKGILGSIAVHSILQNVNCQFLKIKISSNQSQNKQKYTLGTYFIQGLILEGFYKKAVFMVNPQQALHILDNFCDYQLFRQICKNKYFKLSQDNNTFLIQAPRSHTQMKYSMLSLRDIINKYQVAHKFDMISYRYYKQFGMYDKINFLKQLTIPEYLPYTKHIIGNSQNLTAFLNKQLSVTYEILTKGSQLQTADAVLGLLCILHNGNLQNQLFLNCTLNSFLQYYRCIKYLRNIINKLDGFNSLNIIRTILVFYQCKLIQNYKSMSFIGSGYCFVNRTSNMSNQLIEQLKTNPDAFAYFFEQDFNYIMVKISSVMKVIKNKFDNRLSKFLINRIQTNRFQNKILPDDYVLHNEQLVIVQALKQAINNLSCKNDKKGSKQKPKKAKDSQMKPKFDYKTHGKIQHAYILRQQQLSDDEQYEQKKVIHSRQKFVLPSYSKQMTYLAEQLISIFNKKSKGCQQIAVGKQLYCANLNQYYRQYIEKMGGYNLYDAIQYKRFKRVDMYAENILSVMETLPIIDKHIYTAEILILLLVQYKRLTQNNQFTIKIMSSYLKFFEGLQLKQQNNEQSIEKQFQNYKEEDLHSNIEINKKKFTFSYVNNYSGDLGPKQILQLICQYLEIVLYEEKSQFIDLSDLCMVYIVNLTPNNQNKPLYQKLKKVIHQLAAPWNNEYYDQLTKGKKLQDFIQIRQKIMKRNIPLHQIKVTCAGDIEKIIDQSQRDYQIQTKIINGRKKALTKIINWWRKNKVSTKLRLQKGIVNYFDYTLKKQLQNANSQNYKSLNDFRMFQKIHDCNLTLNIPLILKIQKTRQDLLKFYLKHFVSNSLDFHYILITLRKIQALKDQYISICKQLQQGIVQRDIEKELSTISQQITDLIENINTWKNDQKWLRQKDINLKRKKVFEVKWMTKSLNQMKIIQKRANLRKQQKLQQKKKYIKN